MKKAKKLGEKEQVIQHLARLHLNSKSNKISKVNL